jgi:RNA polymerase-associated protein
MNANLLTLYSDPLDPDCHRVRLLAAEKEDLVEVIEVHQHNIPEELLRINPTGSCPTLCDKDVMLTEAQVIMEYLDERFPNPVLLPIDPTERAKIRMVLATVRDFWFPRMKILDDVGATLEQKEEARKILKKNLLELRPAFAHNEYCMSDEYTLIDVTLAPILWRLKRYAIPIDDFGIEYELYMKKVFTRKAFANSLSLFEEGMQ